MAQALDIAVHISGALRDYCGGAPDLHVSASTVRAALEEIERTHPPLYRSVCDETGKVRRHVNLFVNSSNVRDLDGLDSKLARGDALTILQAVSGG